MSTFTDQMYGNAATSARGLVTGSLDAPVRRSWGEVHQQARKMAGALANAGVGPGSVVAVSPATRPTSHRSPRRIGLNRQRSCSLECVTATGARRRHCGEMSYRIFAVNEWESIEMGSRRR